MAAARRRPISVAERDIVPDRWEGMRHGCVFAINQRGCGGNCAISLHRRNLQQLNAASEGNGKESPVSYRRPLLEPHIATSMHIVAIVMIGAMLVIAMLGMTDLVMMMTGIFRLAQTGMNGLDKRIA